MWVKDFMIRGVCTIHPEATVAEAVKIMVENKTNSLIVVDENDHPVGLLSSYTLIKAAVPAYLQDDPIFANYGAEGTIDRYAEKIKGKEISDLMYKEFHILKEEDAMIEAAAYAIGADRRILPVVDQGGRLIGAITRTSIKNALYQAIHKDRPLPPSSSSSTGS
jgi:predicted transcriptional regulator